MTQALNSSRIKRGTLSGVNLSIPVSRSSSDGK